MASAPVMYITQNGANVFPGGQMMPGTVVQPTGQMMPGTVVQPARTVQYVGQPAGHPVNQPQQRVPGTGLQAFLQIQPRALGAIQIMIGLIHLGFGAVSYAMFYFFYPPVSIKGGYPFWGGIFFIASGSVSVSAENHLNSKMVETSVGLNITSAVMALTGIILYCIDLPLLGSIFYQDNQHKYWRDPAGTGIVALLLLFSFLEFSIAVTSAHFGCKAACCKNNTVKASVGLNIISALVALIGIIPYCLYFYIVVIDKISINVLAALQFSLLLLEFWLTVLTAFYGCRAICH